MAAVGAEMWAATREPQLPQGPALPGVISQSLSLAPNRDLVSAPQSTWHVCLGDHGACATEKELYSRSRVHTDMEQCGSNSTVTGGTVTGQESGKGSN